MFAKEIYREGWLQMRIPLRIALLTALLLLAGAVYKWVDKQGVVHYSDKPPPGQAAEEVAIAPSPAVEQRSPSAGQAEAAASAAAAQPGAGVKQPTAPAAKSLVLQAQVERCADAQVQRKTLDLQTPIYRRSRPGEFLYLADADRPAEKQRLDAEISEACSSDPDARAAQRQRFIELSLGRRWPCVALRDEIQDRRARNDPDEAEAIAQAIERLEKWHCPEVSVSGVWLAKRDYDLQPPTD